VYLSGLPADAYERERGRYWSMVAPTEHGQLSALQTTIDAGQRAMRALDQHVGATHDRTAIGLLEKGAVSPGEVAA
jgi:hypothetical protein